MMVQQISVFLENKKGKLAEITDILAENNIDICAISIADTTNFGILRMLVNNPIEAVEIVKKAGYTVSMTEVVAVEIKDRPGALNKVLHIMNENNISIEYLYSFVRSPGKNALILFKVEDAEKVNEILKKQDISIISQQDIYGL